MVTSKSVTNLPLKGNKSAPKTFTGKYDRVEDFFYEVETACDDKGVTSDKDKCKAIVRYCSDKVVKVIRGLKEYKANDYDALKKELIFIYDGDRTEVQYNISDVYPLVKKW